MLKQSSCSKQLEIALKKLKSKQPGRRQPSICKLNDNISYHPKNFAFIINIKTNGNHSANIHHNYNGNNLNLFLFFRPSFPPFLPNPFLSSLLPSSSALPFIPPSFLSAFLLPSFLPFLSPSLLSSFLACLPPSVLPAPCIICLRLSLCPSYVLLKRIILV